MKASNNNKQNKPKTGRGVGTGGYVDAVDAETCRRLITNYTKGKVISPRLLMSEKLLLESVYSGINFEGSLKRGNCNALLLAEHAMTIKLVECGYSCYPKENLKIAAYSESEVVYIDSITAAPILKCDRRKFAANTVHNNTYYVKVYDGIYFDTFVKKTLLHAQVVVDYDTEDSTINFPTLYTKWDDILGLLTIANSKITINHTILNLGRMYYSREYNQEKRLLYLYYVMENCKQTSKYCIDDIMVMHHILISEDSKVYKAYEHTNEYILSHSEDSYATKLIALVPLAILNFLGSKLKVKSAESFEKLKQMTLTSLHTTVQVKKWILMPGVNTGVLYQTNNVYPNQAIITNVLNPSLNVADTVYNTVLEKTKIARQVTVRSLLSNSTVGDKQIVQLTQSVVPVHKNQTNIANYCLLDSLINSGINISVVMMENLCGKAGIGWWDSDDLARVAETMQFNYVLVLGNFATICKYVDNESYITIINHNNVHWTAGINPEHCYSNGYANVVMCSNEARLAFNRTYEINNERLSDIPVEDNAKYEALLAVSVGTGTIMDITTNNEIYNQYIRYIRGVDRELLNNQFYNDTDVEHALQDAVLAKCLLLAKYELCLPKDTTIKLASNVINKIELVDGVAVVNQDLSAMKLKAGDCAYILLRNSDSCTKVEIREVQVLHGAKQTKITFNDTLNASGCSVYFTMDSIQSANIQLKKLLSIDLKNFDPEKVKLVLGVVGSGKTTSIRDYLDKNKGRTNFIVAQSSATVDKLRREFTGVKLCTVEKFIKSEWGTVIDNVIVDEVMQIDVTDIIYIQAKYNCNVYAVGDSMQIKPIGQTEALGKWVPVTVDKIIKPEEVRSYSYRLNNIMGQKCVKMCPDLEWDTSKKGTYVEYSIKSLADVKTSLLCDGPIICWTREVKTELAAMFKDRQVFTVHEFEGEECENVNVVFYWKTSHVPDHLLNPSYALVALSRNTFGCNVFVYDTNLWKSVTNTVVYGATQLDIDKDRRVVNAPAVTVDRRLGFQFVYDSRFKVSDGPAWYGRDIVFMGKYVLGRIMMDGNLDVHADAFVYTNINDEIKEGLKILIADNTYNMPSTSPVKPSQPMGGSLLRPDGTFNSWLLRLVSNKSFKDEMVMINKAKKMFEPELRVDNVMTSDTTLLNCVWEPKDRKLVKELARAASGSGVLKFDWYNFDYLNEDTLLFDSQHGMFVWSISQCRILESYGQANHSTTLDTICKIHAYNTKVFGAVKPKKVYHYGIDRTWMAANDLTPGWKRRNYSITNIGFLKRFAALKMLASTNGNPFTFYGASGSFNAIGYFRLTLNLFMFGCAQCNGLRISINGETLFVFSRQSTTAGCKDYSLKYKTNSRMPAFVSQILLWLDTGKFKDAAGGLLNLFSGLSKLSLGDAMVWYIERFFVNCSFSRDKVRDVAVHMMDNLDTDGFKDMHKTIGPVLIYQDPAKALEVESWAGKHYAYIIDIMNNNTFTKYNIFDNGEFENFCLHLFRAMKFSWVRATAQWTDYFNNYAEMRKVMVAAEKSKLMGIDHVEVLSKQMLKSVDYHISHNTNAVGPIKTILKLMEEDDYTKKSMNVLLPGNVPNQIGSGKLNSNSDDAEGNQQFRYSTIHNFVADTKANILLDSVAVSYLQWSGGKANVPDAICNLHLNCNVKGSAGYSKIYEKNVTYSPGDYVWTYIPALSDNILPSDDDVMHVTNGGNLLDANLLYMLSDLRSATTDILSKYHLVSELRYGNWLLCKVSKLDSLMPSLHTYTTKNAGLHNQIAECSISWNMCYDSLISALKNMGVSRKMVTKVNCEFLNKCMIKLMTNSYEYKEWCEVFNGMVMRWQPNFKAVKESLSTHSSQHYNTMCMAIYSLYRSTIPRLNYTQDFVLELMNLIPEFKPLMIESYDILEIMSGLLSIFEEARDTMRDWVNAKLGVDVDSLIQMLSNATNIDYTNFGQAYVMPSITAEAEIKKMDWKILYGTTQDQVKAASIIYKAFKSYSTRIRLVRGRLNADTYIKNGSCHDITGYTSSYDRHSLIHSDAKDMVSIKHLGGNVVCCNCNNWAYRDLIANGRMSVVATNMCNTKKMVLQMGDDTNRGTYSYDYMLDVYVYYVDMGINKLPNYNKAYVETKLRSDPDLLVTVTDKSVYIGSKDPIVGVTRSPNTGICSGNEVLVNEHSNYLALNARPGTTFNLLADLVSAPSRDGYCNIDAFNACYPDVPYVGTNSFEDFLANVLNQATGTLIVQESTHGYYVAMTYGSYALSSPVFVIKQTVSDSNHVEFVTRLEIESCTVMKNNRMIETDQITSTVGMEIAKTTGMKLPDLWCASKQFASQAIQYTNKTRFAERVLNRHYEKMDRVPFFSLRFELKDNFVCLNKESYDAVNSIGCPINGKRLYGLVCPDGTIQPFTMIKNGKHIAVLTIMPLKVSENALYVALNLRINLFRRTAKQAVNISRDRCYVIGKKYQTLAMGMANQTVVSIEADLLSPGNVANLQDGSIYMMELDTNMHHWNTGLLHSVEEYPEKFRLIGCSESESVDYLNKLSDSISNNNSYKKCYKSGKLWYSIKADNALLKVVELNARYYSSSEVDLMNGCLLIDKHPDHIGPYSKQLFYDSKSGVTMLVKSVTSKRNIIKSMLMLNEGNVSTDVSEYFGKKNVKIVYNRGKVVGDFTMLEVNPHSRYVLCKLGTDRVVLDQFAMVVYSPQVTGAANRGYDYESFGLREIEPASVKNSDYNYTKIELNLSKFISTSNLAANTDRKWESARAEIEFDAVWFAMKSNNKTHIELESKKWLELFTQWDELMDSINNMDKNPLDGLSANKNFKVKNLPKVITKTKELHTYLELGLSSYWKPPSVPSGLASAVNQRVYGNVDVRKTLLGYDKPDSYSRVLLDTFFNKGYESESEINIDVNASLKWIKEHPNPEVKERELTSLLMSGCLTSEIYSVLKVRVHEKIESLVKEAETHSIDNITSRLIMWYSYIVSALFGPCYDELKRRMKKHSKGWLKYVDGMSATELQLHMRSTNMSINSVIVENDLEKQDKQTDMFTIAVEYLVYEAFGLNKQLSELIQYSRKKWYWATNSLSGSQSGCRLSGEPATSLGNFLTNLQSHLKLIVIDKVRPEMMYILGDDNLLICSDNVTEAMLVDSGKFANMNCKPSIRKSSGVFLRMYVYNTGNCLNVAPDMDRLIRKLRLPNQVQKKDEDYILSRNLSYLSMIGNGVTYKIGDQVLQTTNWYDSNTLRNSSMANGLGDSEMLKADIEKLIGATRTTKEVIVRNISWTAES